MNQLPPSILLLLAPLAAAVIIPVLTLSRPRISAGISIVAVLFSLILSIKLAALIGQGGTVEQFSWPWLTVGNVTFEIGALVDRLSALMLVVVTGVGAVIQIYSLTYMRGDSGFSRYYACMSLFIFSMLGVVLASNFIQMFLFWELVGMSSYLLIGFWFERPSAALASQKAFVVNRIGDFGFLIGILLVGSLGGSFNFETLAGVWPGLHLDPSMYALAAALIFCGAVGKSAQVPLHVWLPDAMEGPTPVSALIHAATMVAAGVYLLCRTSWLLVPAPFAMDLVAWVGGITALFAALVALTQRDLKRILAYSTLSQLGYMVMAVGLGGSLEAMFHLTTHAFFKALLFLAAGSVILALHHEQDIGNMGGLAKKMPLTAAVFAIGTLALAGIWPFSGFYSKDAILMLALHHNHALMYIGVITAALTAFYMGRAFSLVFLGNPRDPHLHDHAHEQGWAVVIPLVLLAIPAVGAGWDNQITSFLRPHHVEAEHALKLIAGFLAVPLVALLGALLLYRRGMAGDEALRRRLGVLYTALSAKLYVDEFYAVLVRCTQGVVAIICEFIEMYILRTVSEGMGRLVKFTGHATRLIQTGNVRGYVFLSSLGAALLVGYILLN